MRQRRTFDSRRITETARRLGVTRIVGPELAGLFFVQRNGQILAVIADGPYEAGLAAVSDDLTLIFGRSPYLDEYFTLSGVAIEGKFLNWESL